EARPRRCRSRLGDLARQARGGVVDLVDLVLEAVLGEDDASTAEGVGLDQVGTGVEIRLMHALDGVRTGEHQVLIAPFQVWAAKIVGAELPRLQGGSCCG